MMMTYRVLLIGFNVLKALHVLRSLTIRAQKEIGSVIILFHREGIQGEKDVNNSSKVRVVVVIQSLISI